MMHLSDTQYLAQAELNGYCCASRGQTRTFRVKATTSDCTTQSVRTQNSGSVGDRVQGVEDRVQGVADRVQGVGDRVQGVGDRVRAQRWTTPWGVMVVAVATLLSIVTMEVTAFIPDFLEWGYCSTAKLQEDFDPVKYQGLWWDIARVPNEYQKASVCLSQNISWTGSALEVANSGLTAAGEKAGAFVSMVEEARRDPPNPAYMTVTSEGVPAAPYQVLSTDYTHYACVYSCLQFPGVFGEFFWIFGRAPTMSKELQQICLDRFEDVGINTDKLVQVEQGESCPYYPHLAQLQGFNTNLFNELESGSGGGDSNSIFETGRSHQLSLSDQVSHSDAFVSSPSAAPSDDSASLPTRGSSNALTSSLLLLLPSLPLLRPSVWLLR